MRLVTALFLAAALLPAQVRRDRHVVIISIDGFPAFSLRDPALPVPNLRRLAAAGAFADGGMETVNPAVTWPNHTSMITGVRPARHGVIYNGLPVRGEGGIPVKLEPWADKDKLVLSPTLYDVAFKAGLTTGEIDWVAITNPGTITYSFAEVPKVDAACVKEMIAAGGVSEAEVSGFRSLNIVMRDELWTRAAEHMIEKHKPNLLLFHTLTTDSSQHQYGAGSLGGNSALALADARVGRVLDAIQRAGIQDSTTVIVVSDHGFRSYKASINPLDRLPADIAKDVFSFPEGGTAMIYIRSSRRAELTPRVRAIFAASGDGIASVVGPEDFGKLGYPDLEKSDRMADLVLAATPGYTFGGRSGASTGGSHGYLSTDSDMDAIFIASGAGVRPGVKLGKIRNLDVAPTAAKLLGLEMSDIEGKPLTAALR
ncbi:MAG: ectonucleotide pyrophosphatase/phosphodiesterase [Bryobacteraceae bacterium]|nr:ectonucleotide pyrophosphatase/phosphodiesterase [Bryobacteraceae bacterium]